MKVCIPTTDESGLNSTASEHFGSAPFFTLVDTESGQLEVIRNAGRDHEHGTCHPMSHLTPRHLDAVICQGMGRRALASLQEAGIDVLVTDKETVSEMIAAARKGELSRLPGEEACLGRGPERGHCR